LARTALTVQVFAATVPPMSQPSRSALQQLLDVKLPGGLDAWVNERFAQGLGYRLVARAIGEETGVGVSPEVLRKWFPAKDRPGTDEQAS
jgi:hypothetical protein